MLINDIYIHTWNEITKTLRVLMGLSRRESKRFKPTTSNKSKNFTLGSRLAELTFREYIPISNKKPFQIKLQKTKEVNASPKISITPCDTHNIKALI